MSEINWNEKIKEAIDRTEFMALSTIGDSGTWTCPLAFSYDQSVNLYFISMMDATHVQNLIKNPTVSVAIYRTERFGEGDVIGLQLTGKAKHVTEAEERALCSEHYFGRGDSNEEFRSSVEGENATWQFFKVEPDQLWYFNSAELGEKRTQVPLETLNIPAPN